MVKIQDPIVAAVIDKIAERSRVGKKKYGVTLEEEKDLSMKDWLSHIQEELMDAVNYIEKLKNVLQEEIEECYIRDAQEKNKEWSGKV